MAEKPSASEKKSGLGDTIFAFVHLALLIAIVIYTVVLFALGTWPRASVISACLVLYYFLVLHRPVIREIRRKRKLKFPPPERKQ